MYYPLARKALFQPDPERTHELILQRLRRITGAPLEALVRQKASAKPITCIGLTFKNPLGLATGLDGDGECIDALGAMEFGSAEIGTVTPRPQPGSGKPRLFRLVDAESLVSRVGFNNHGVDNLAESVKESHLDGVLGINISEDEDTPVRNGKDDYSICMEKVYAYAGYITISISSPSMPGLRTLQYGEALGDLLMAIKNRQNDPQAIHHKYVPVTVEIVSGLSMEKLTRVADSLIHRNIDGVIATNTTLGRPLVQEMRNCDQMDGLNGRPLQLKSTEIIRQLSQELKGQLSIIGVGDIDSAAATHERIAAGATLAWIYSGFIFKDPPLVKEIISNI